MKKYSNLYIDDFMLEKKVSHWVWKRMIERYQSIFNLFTQTPYIIATDLSTYTTKNFKKFLWENLISRNWSSSTYNNYRKYLKCYCQYLKNEWYLEENPFDNIVKRKETIQLPKTLTRDEVKELILKLPKIFDMKTYIWKRNETIVLTYLYTWLRLSELINLNIENLQLHQWYIKVIKGKGGKDRVIPISRILVKKLAQYMLVRNKDFEDNRTSPLFPTFYWNHLQKRDLKIIMSKLRESLNFYFTWHQLRHTFATELVRNNFDIYNISRILWHSSIDTTKIYLSVDTEKLKQQLDSIKLFS